MSVDPRAHPERERRLFRVPHANGEHVIERCMACGANARGTARWVSPAGIDVSLLAVDPWLGLGHAPQQDAPCAPSSQRSLFGGKP